MKLLDIEPHKRGDRGNTSLVSKLCWLFGKIDMFLETLRQI